MNADPRSDEQAAAATYIASLTSALADLARQRGLMELSYLLEMARLEAEDISFRMRASAEEGRSAPPEEDAE
jgi:hypothetical protein